MRPYSLRGALVLALLLPISGCGVLDPDPWDDRRDALERGRAKWAAAAMDRYSYTLRRSCFCGFHGEFRVTVRGDSVTEVVATATGERVDPPGPDVVPGVEGLFETVEEAIDAEVYQLDVEYHAELGYPTLISVDWDRHAVDDEMVLTARDLSP